MTIWREDSDGSVVSGAHRAIRETPRSIDLSICVGSSVFCYSNHQEWLAKNTKTSVNHWKSTVPANTNSLVAQCQHFQDDTAEEDESWHRVPVHSNGVVCQARAVALDLHHDKEYWLDASREMRRDVYDQLVRVLCLPTYAWPHFELVAKRFK